MLGSIEPPSPEEITRDLAHELMSPYCPGRTVASCPTSQARRLEEEIQQKAEAGQSADEIKAELLARFGEERLGSSSNPAVVYGTMVVAVLGALGLAQFVRKRLASRRLGSKPASWAKEHAAPTIQPTRRELDALEDELDRVDDF